MTNPVLELSDLTKFRLDEINKIKDYLNAEIKERKDIVKKISKYIVAFDYADKLFITLSALFGTLSTVSYATVVGIPVGMAGTSLNVIFTVTTCYWRRVVQKILLNTIAHILNNMTQMLQVSENSNIKYNIIHVKTKPKRIYQIAKLD